MMTNKSNGILDSLKFIFSIGTGGIGALGLLYAIAVNNLGLGIMFFIIVTLSGLLILKAATIAATGFAFGTLLFGIQASRTAEYGYGDAIWSFVFFVVMIGIIIFRRLI